MKPRHLKVIALDFDGTLVESNQIKDEAFKTLFSKWPDHQEAMIRWHLNHNSIDRREKFHYFVEEVLGFSDRNDLVEKLTQEFSKLTLKAIIECPLVEGAQEFLEYFNGKAPLFLVSATPEKELNEITTAKGMHKYFKQIYGAPINKKEILKKIMISEKVSAEEMIFIGDSPEDEQDAIKVGIYFVTRKSDRTLYNSSYCVFEDMKSIRYYLENGNIKNREYSNV